MNQRPATKAHTQRLQGWVGRNQWLILLGLRTVITSLLGMARVHPLRFTLCNGVSALVWSVLVLWLGQWLVHWLRQWVGHLHPLDFWIVGGLLMFGLVVLLLHRTWQRQTL